MADSNIDALTVFTAADADDAADKLVFWDDSAVAAARTKGILITEAKKLFGAGELGIVIDGAGSVITTGIKGYLRVPWDCTIDSNQVLLDQSGSIVIDVWKDTYANFPPLDADSITASAPPTVTSAQKSEDSTLTGWTTSLSEGDILAFNVDSITTATRATLTIEITKN